MKKKAETTNITTSAQPTSDVVHAVAETPGDRCGVAAEHERPQQDRALESRPHGGDVVEQRRVGRSDLLDVGHREVAGDQRALHHDHREHDPAERDEGVHRALSEQALVAAADAVEDRQRAEHARREHQQQSRSAQRRVHARGDQHHGVVVVQPACSASSTRSSFTATYSSECLTSTRSPDNSPFVDHRRARRPECTPGRCHPVHRRRRPGSSRR